MHVLRFKLFAFLLFGIQTINAQLVNIEKYRKQSINGLSTDIGVAINLKDNGSEIFKFKNTIDIQYRQTKHSYILLNNLEILQLDGNNLENTGYQHFRYNYTVRDTSFFTFEYFVQHQHNSQKKLLRRIISGFGPRFRVANHEKMVFFIAPLIMYEYEKLDPLYGSETFFWRLDAYVSLYWQITKSLSFKNVTYYQPHFLNVDDFRVSHESSVGIKITNRLSFGVSLELSYDSDPPEEVQKRFYTLDNKLVFSF